MVKNEMIGRLMRDATDLAKEPIVAITNFLGSATAGLDDDLSSFSESSVSPLSFLLQTQRSFFFLMPWRDGGGGVLEASFGSITSDFQLQCVLLSEVQRDENGDGEVVVNCVDEECEDNEKMQNEALILMREGSVLCKEV
ncbi:unnamed protein product [Vicia faba]|uniref:Uncharacterized protein n=1 Tax=Vicia faba TaxID=3906 RepID=A0AAV0Z589_VICFA|nr:unnamed protein product [Vicia faba]